jgi:Kef-type K+ transport system membrane component KefB
MVLNQAISLLVISLAVAVLPAVARFARLPQPVTEIIFGVILGQSLLGVHFSGEWMPFLAELGFLLLMFAAGMEIDFNMLTRLTRRQWLFQVVLFGVTLGLGMAAARILGQGFFFALILTTTSLGLVMPTLREMGLTRRPLGQRILIAATLADFLTLLGITVYVLARDYGASWHLGAPLPLFLGFALLLWAFRRWAWWNPETARRLLLTDNSQEQGMRVALALLFVFVGLSELVELEPVLGAFMGGAILSFVYREKEAIESKVSALGFGFLIPIFFIHVGMTLDATNVVADGGLLFTAGLLAAAVLVKLLPGLLFPLFGMPLSQGLRMGVLMISRLSLIIAAASIGLERGYITASTRDAIVLLALVTCLAGPTLFRAVAPGQRRQADS